MNLSCSAPKMVFWSTESSTTDDPLPIHLRCYAMQSLRVCWLRRRQQWMEDWRGLQVDVVTPLHKVYLLHCCTSSISANSPLTSCLLQPSQVYHQNNLHMSRQCEVDLIIQQCGLRCHVETVQLMLVNSLTK